MTIYVVLYHNDDERDAFPLAAFQGAESAAAYVRQMKDDIYEEEWYTIHEMEVH